MTKFESAALHIELREQFYEVKYGRFERAYAHFRMFFMPEALIVGANAALRQVMQDNQLHI